MGVITHAFVMGAWDSIVKYLASNDETEEEKKKRLAKQLENNPLYQATHRTNKIDKAIEESQK